MSQDNIYTRKVSWQTSKCRYIAYKVPLLYFPTTILTLIVASSCWNSSPKNGFLLWLPLYMCTITSSHKDWPGRIPARPQYLCYHKSNSKLLCPKYYTKCCDRVQSGVDTYINFSEFWTELPHGTSTWEGGGIRSFSHHISVLLELEWRQLLTRPVNRSCQDRHQGGVCLFVHVRRYNVHVRCYFVTSYLLLLFGQGCVISVNSV